MLEMAQYEADKVIALLQFCCWKWHLKMDHQGLLRLREKLVEFNENKQGITGKNTDLKMLNEKYLVDLLSDSNTASKKDNRINKSKAYLDLLLEFAGFGSWDNWEIHYNNASEYLSTRNIDLSDFSSLGIGICFPVQLEKKLSEHLPFVNKHSTYPLQLLPLDHTDPSEQLKYALDILREYPLVICALPVQWSTNSEVFKGTLWKELIQSQRILPVWLNESSIWEIHLSEIPWLKNSQTIGGLRGLLCGLLYIYEVFKQTHYSGDGGTGKSQVHSQPTQIQNFQHSRGVFLLGAINSKQTAMGDIHQVINNYNKKEDDTND